MAARDFTASVADRKCVSFPSAFSHPDLRVAEESGRYGSDNGADAEVDEGADNKGAITVPVDDIHFVRGLGAIDAWALRKTAHAQLGRIYRLADLLDFPAVAERPAAALILFAAELRQATDSLEEAVNTLAERLAEKRS